MYETKIEEILVLMAQQIAEVAPVLGGSSGENFYNEFHTLMEELQTIRRQDESIANDHHGLP